MKIGKGREGDVIDRRGASRGMGGLGGGGLPIPIGVGGGGIGIVLLLVFLGIQLFGGGGGGSGGFGDIFSQVGGGPVAPQGAQGIPPESDPDRDMVEFLKFVSTDVNDHWERYFAQSNQQYQRVPLVLFEGQENTGCGIGSSGTGPFYCPADLRAYLDVDFFDELHRRFGAPGDFAAAYVVAHEVGHHIQTLTGVSERVRQESGRNPGEANELSVRQELQADCFAGVWGNSANQRGILDAGDLEEALTAAAAIGDDRIQQQSGERVNPESWTHGSGEQRATWFRRGFETGDPNQCDTFSVSNP